MENNRKNTLENGASIWGYPHDYGNPHKCIYIYINVNINIIIMIIIYIYIYVFSIVITIIVDYYITYLHIIMMTTIVPITILCQYYFKNNTYIYI